MRKEAKFTPGPWSDDHNRHNGDTCVEIATVHCITTRPTEDGLGQRWTYITAAKPCYDVNATEQDANAHLIAAAPELYDALDDCVTILRHKNLIGGSLENALRVLAKARGAA